MIPVKHGTHEATDTTDNGHHTILQGDELGQAAGFVVTGDDKHISPGIDHVGQFGVEAQLDVTVGVVVEVEFFMPEPRVDRAFGGGTKEDKLGSPIQGVVHGMVNEMNAFLVIETANVGDDRSVIVFK